MSEELDAGGNPVLTPVQRYAIGLVHAGAMHVAEDDTDEDGVFDDEDDWKAACDLGIKMALAIKGNPREFRNWYWAISS